MFEQKVLFRADFLSMSSMPRGEARCQNLGHLIFCFYFSDMETFKNNMYRLGYFSL